MHCPDRRRPAHSCARNRRGRPDAGRPAADARRARNRARSSPSAAAAGRARHLGDLAVDPAEPRRDRVFQPALGHQLHADADAEERRAGVGRGFDRRGACPTPPPARARNRRRRPGRAARCGRRADHVRVGGHRDLGGDARPARPPAPARARRRPGCRCHSPPPRPSCATCPARSTRSGRPSSRRAKRRVLGAPRRPRAQQVAAQCQRPAAQVMARQDRADTRSASSTGPTGGPRQQRRRDPRAQRQRRRNPGARAQPARAARTSARPS